MDVDRQIRIALRKLLNYDVYLTRSFCAWSSQFLPYKSFQFYYEMLEISAHCVPWIFGWMAFIGIWNNPRICEMQMLFLFGIIIDILVVAAIKSNMPRRRPSNLRSLGFATVNLKRFSFPSGHASRACFIVYYFTCIWNLSLFLLIPLVLWCIVVCISRVLLRKQFVIDVVAGALLGWVEGMLIQYWLLPEDQMNV